MPGTTDVLPRWAAATCTAGRGNRTTRVTFLVAAVTSCSAPERPVSRASAMTPAGDSATDRAKSLTEKLDLTWPVAELIWNRPALSGPVSAHMTPLSWNSVAASMLPGACSRRSGRRP